MRVVANAAITAAIVAIADALEAIINERIVASCICVLAQAEAYHFSENPSQIAIDAPALKE